MKLVDWLKDRAGLTGKKLQGAFKLCADNWIETVSDLRELADEDNKEQFKEAFPQALLRTSFLKAFKADSRGSSVSTSQGVRPRVS